jgi:DNA polymerase-1
MVNPRTGRVHTSFNQAVVATGRISSSDPNLQNIPARTEVGRQIRRAFIAAPLPDGTPTRLISADYSQIELRILAHITGDPNLVEAFEAGQDIHTATAAKVFGVPPDQVTPLQRRVAKMMNFAVVYGISEYGLTVRTELSREEAAEFIRNYFAIYPKVKEYTQEIVKLARRQGYVATLLGRRRYLPEINSPNATVRAAAERMAINMPIQGTAADIMKLAMINLHRRLKAADYRARMVLQVHDELVLEAAADQIPEVGRLVREVMTTAYPLRVPLEVGVACGPNWDELEPLEPTAQKAAKPAEDIEFEQFAVE